MSDTFGLDPITFGIAIGWIECGMFIATIGLTLWVLDKFRE